jgi:hypothetical protein
LVTEVGFFQRIFDTTRLNGQQWTLCILLAASMVIVAEVAKWIGRLVIRGSEQEAPPAAGPASAS